MLLDIASHKPADWIRERFPQIHERCAELNIDITSRPIPVIPAAHYFCGGVLVDLWGRATLPSLYGAMLAGVGFVLMGAGIPKAIPGILVMFTLLVLLTTRFNGYRDPQRNTYGVKPI